MVTADEVREGIYKVYRDKGYNYEQDFPGKYRFFHNEKTGEKVRVYYSSFEPVMDWQKRLVIRLYVG